MTHTTLMKRRRGPSPAPNLTLYPRERVSIGWLSEDKVTNR
jgi:hypothetical protein